MAKDYEARVIRAYSLPVDAFDHLKATVRLRQWQVDPTGESHTVTNSEALTRILRSHYALGTVAAFQGMQTEELCLALATGRLVVTQPPVPTL